MAVSTTTSSGGHFVHYEGTAQEVINAVEALKGNLIQFGFKSSSTYFALCEAL